MLAKWPPLKLAQFAFAGSLVFALDCLSAPFADELLKLRDRFFPADRGAFTVTGLILILFAPILIGALIIFLAKRRLFAGLDNDQWPDREVEKARLWVQSPVLKRIAKGLVWTAIVLWVASVALYIWKGRPGQTVRMVSNSLMFLMIPGFILANLREALRPEPPPYDPSKTRTSGMKRFQSEHGVSAVPPTQTQARFNNRPAATESQPLKKLSLAAPKSRRALPGRSSAR